MSANDASGPRSSRRPRAGHLRLVPATTLEPESASKPAPRRPWGRALRRLETIDRSLDLVEADVSTLARLGHPEKELDEAIHCGLSWASHAIRGAGYALDDPGVRRRADGIRERLRRLFASFRPLH